MVFLWQFSSYSCWYVMARASALSKHWGGSLLGSPATTLCLLEHGSWIKYVIPPQMHGLCSVQEAARSEGWLCWGPGRPYQARTVTTHGAVCGGSFTHLLLVLSYHVLVGSSLQNWRCMDLSCFFLKVSALL